ncbi:MAG TPA: hypothetical protein VI455_13360 [Terriglobia bacterium]
MSCTSRRDYLRRIYARYQQACGAEKERILDEFCANCDYNRKYAIRLLNGPAPSGRPVGKRRRRRGFTCGPRVLSILKAVWEAADDPWWVRLKALWPEWMPWIRRRFRRGAETEQPWLGISPRSIDYRRLYGRTQPGTLLKPHLPLKTDHGDVLGAGLHRDRLGFAFGQLGCGRFLLGAQLDRDPHGLDRDAGRAGQEPEAVRGALQAIPLACMNDPLDRYGQVGALQFRRGRPYQKDDHAPIEPKNWRQVRRLRGYGRYDTAAAREALNDRHRHERRRFQNLFLPSVKLAQKERVGSRRRYQAPQTPLQRLAASGAADPARLAELQGLREGLDPLELSAPIEAKLKGIFALSREAPAPSPAHRAHDRESNSSPRAGLRAVGNIYKLQDEAGKVTFLDCLTG